MDNYPVINPIEEAIDKQTNNLMGNYDTNLKTIIKMAKMKDLCPNVKKDEFDSIIEQMKENNKLLVELINKEYELTYDINGKIILLNDINNEKESKS